MIQWAISLPGWGEHSRRSCKCRTCSMAGLILAYWRHRKRPQGWNGSAVHGEDLRVKSECVRKSLKGLSKRGKWSNAHFQKEQKLLCRNTAGSKRESRRWVWGSQVSWERGWTTVRGGSDEGGMMTGFEWSESGESPACCYLQMAPSPFAVISW